MEQVPEFELSLVIPVYRESARIQDFAQNLRSFTGRWQFPIQLILVQDPSAEDRIEADLLKQELAATARLQVEWITSPRRLGRGASVRRGLENATGKFIFVLSVDLNVPLAEIPNSLRDFTERPDLALLIGNRLSEKKLRHGPRNHWLSAFENAQREKWQKKLPGLTDPTCSFVAIRQNAKVQLLSNFQPRRWFWSPDLLANAFRQNLLVSEKAIVCHDSLPSRFGWREAFSSLW